MTPGKVTADDAYEPIIRERIVARMFPNMFGNCKIKRKKKVKKFSFKMYRVKIK